MEFPKCIQYSFKRCGIFLAVTMSTTLISIQAKAQLNDTLPFSITLEKCIDYAMNHQPAIEQTKIDEAITEKIIKIKLADWYPQLSLGYNILHYLQLPAVTNPLALKNNSTAAVSLTQNVFSSDIWLAGKTAGDVRLNARQNTQLTRISLVVQVSKSFYDVLVSQKQIDLTKQDIVRLQKTLKDALAQYQAGTSDKTDYQRATIALNNAVAQKKQYEELLKGKLALLKQLMGYTGNEELKPEYNNENLQDEIILDPTDGLSYEGRVEFQQLETQKSLLEYSLKSAKLSGLPTVSLFGNYNLIAQNNALSKTYSEFFPNSLVGLTLSMPIFQGGKRIQRVKQADLELRRLEWDFQNLKTAINTEYVSALAAYKASLNDYTVSKNNLSLAQEVYTTIHLQYMSGVKTYLDVIVAETDLRTAEVNSLAALYQVLSSKLDVQKAAGTLNY